MVVHTNTFIKYNIMYSVIVRRECDSRCRKLHSVYNNSNNNTDDDDKLKQLRTFRRAALIEIQHPLVVMVTRVGTLRRGRHNKNTQTADRLHYNNNDLSRGVRGHVAACCREILHSRFHRHKYTTYYYYTIIAYVNESKQIHLYFITKSCFFFIFLFFFRSQINESYSTDYFFWTYYLKAVNTILPMSYNIIL